MSSSETRRAIELCAVRSNLTVVELPLSVLEGLVGGFRGTVVSGKLPKVKENPAAACIWTLTLAEKKTLDLDANNSLQGFLRNCPYLARQLLDCLSGNSTRGMPGGRFVGEGGIPEPRARWLRDDASV